MSKTGLDLRYCSPDPESKIYNIVSLAQAIDKEIHVYLKKTSVLLHSATYKLLYEERAKK